MASGIRNEEKVVITENVCREQEALAAEKQVPSFIDNMPAYRDEWRHSDSARQFTGLKMSNTLSTHPEKKANLREGSGMNSWHHLNARLIWEGRWSISVENDWTKSPLEIRNEEKVGLTKEFCRKKQSLADVKQVESFINNITAYREAMHHSVMARQITGLKTSNSLSTHPGGFGSFIDLRF